MRAALSAAAQGRRCKWLLVVDQLEELLLWARDRGDADAANEREAFAEVLLSLCRSGAVWAIATLRSDCLSMLEDSLALLRLCADDHVYRLERPMRAELKDIVLRPAQAARLTFEGADASGLPFSEVLIEAAAEAPDSLPLLQFALARLFEMEGARGRLTFTSYDRLGRLEGAIGRWAEHTVQALVDGGVPDRTIDQVILSLGQFDASLGVVAARVALIETGKENTDHARVVEALVKARLVTLDERGRARVTHDAVLTHWPRAKLLFEAAARDVNLRDLLEFGGRRLAKQGPRLCAFDPTRPAPCRSPRPIAAKNSALGTCTRLHQG